MSSNDDIATTWLIFDEGGVRAAYYYFAPLTLAQQSVIGAHL
jgi:hypothetical protein